MFDIGDVVQLIDNIIPDYGNVSQELLNTYFIIAHINVERRSLYLTGVDLINVKYDNVKLILKGNIYER